MVTEKLSKLRFAEKGFEFSMKNETSSIIPNILSFSRIMLSVLLLFLPAFSAFFYIIYITAGLSDILDGYIARNTNTASDFGAKLDSSADLVFIIICLIKILPVLEIPKWHAIWMIIIALIKLANYVSSYIMRKKIVSLHTLMNKISGFLLFVFPLTIQIIDLKYSAAIICLVTTFAAVQEGHYIRTGKTVC